MIIMMIMIIITIMIIMITIIITMITMMIMIYLSTSTVKFLLASPTMLRATQVYLCSVSDLACLHAVIGQETFRMKLEVIQVVSPTCQNP